jgi:hypothetical protein
LLFNPSSTGEVFALTLHVYSGDRPSLPTSRKKNGIGQGRAAVFVGQSTPKQSLRVSHQHAGGVR